MPVTTQLRLSLLETWVSSCMAQHDHDSTLETQIADKRNIDRLISRKLFRMIDVVERKVVVIREPCDYVALSYVWGDQMSRVIDRNYGPRLVH